MEIYFPETTLNFIYIYIYIYIMCVCVCVCVCGLAEVFHLGMID